MDDQDDPNDEILKKYSQTYGVTQTLQSDIIQFLTSKYTKNATLTVGEVMQFYDCAEDRARRVIANLINDGVLETVTKDTYRVTI
jgi:hypothetical protein